MFVGDLSDGDIRVTKSISEIPLPTAVILGNHDRGRDQTGDVLRNQLKVLAEKHCSWSLRKWEEPRLAVIGARPCSSGGGFYLSKEVEAVFGPLTIQDSADRIVSAANSAPVNWPMVLLAHSGPTGLGSEAESICGRDWKSPAIDWGDLDLALALNQMRGTRLPALVVFGHMHHALTRTSGYRRTFHKDIYGTIFLNCACVPRRGFDSSGRLVCHFSWVEFVNGQLNHVSHRWYLQDGSLSYEEVLHCKNL